MLHIDFTVPGQPVGQPRQRHSGRVVWMGKKPVCIVKSYVPKDADVVQYKADLLAAAMSARPDGWMKDDEHPDTVYLVAFLAVFKRPKAMPKTKGGWEPCVSAPDKDNMEKAILDALAGFLWHNDSRVFCGVQAKVYAPYGVEPYTRVIAVPCSRKTPFHPETFSGILSSMARVITTFGEPSTPVATHEDSLSTYRSRTAIADLFG